MDRKLYDKLYKFHLDVSKRNELVSGLRFDMDLCHRTCRIFLFDLLSICRTATNRSDGAWA